MDDPAVRADVRDDGRRVEDLRQVAGAADLREALAVLQPALDLEDVDRVARLLELEAGLEDAPVRLRVEVLGLETR